MAKVLVVDDEAAIRESVCDILQAAGHETEAASDGDEALRRLRRAPDIDLMVLDLFMPHDGMGVLDALTNGPVVIVLSAFEYRSLVEMKERFGTRICAFLTKPVPPRDLLRTVEDCLSNAA